MHDAKAVVAAKPGPTYVPFATTTATSKSQAAKAATGAPRKMLPPVHGYNVPAFPHDTPRQVLQRHRRRLLGLQMPLAAQAKAPTRGRPTPVVMGELSAKKEICSRRRRGYSSQGQPVDVCSRSLSYQLSCKA